MANPLADMGPEKFVEHMKRIIEVFYIEPMKDFTRQEIRRQLASIADKGMRVKLEVVADEA